jgi:hypothetical protein
MENMHFVGGFHLWKLLLKYSEDEMHFEIIYIFFYFIYNLNQQSKFTFYKLML